MKFVEALEEISSRGRYIPDAHAETVLRCVLCMTDCRLLLRLHSVLEADACLRPSVGLSAGNLWELMEDCCRKLLSINAPVSTSLPPSSRSHAYPHSAHVVLLYLVCLLGGDVATHKDSLSATIVEGILSLTSQWRHVVVVVDLLQELLLNKSPPSPLPDLLPVLASLLCICVSTSREYDREDGATRLARELSSRMSRLPSVQLKTDLLLLFPCYLLREKTISIHLEAGFLLPSSSQGASLPSEHVTLELIATSHLCRCPCHHNGSLHDLSFFLTLLYHLMHSHCSKLLGPSFLHPNAATWATPPSELAQQLKSVAVQVRLLFQRLSGDDALLFELTTPSCWFYLQLLERMFKWVIP